jgi:fucose 4-O-acetylase-like acetyltransferase
VYDERRFEVAKAGRNDLIDALKFFAIALVPLQHLLNLRDEFRFMPGAHAFVVWMVSFDMPLFVFLSGYVLFGREGRDRVSFLWRKALALLVPYFAWVIVEMGVERLPLTQWPGKLGMAAIQPHDAYQMWFLWVLFVLFAIFTLVTLVGRSTAWLAIVAVSFEAARFLPATKVAGLDKILLLMPFLLLGYVVARHREALRSFDAWIAFVGVATFAVVSFLSQNPVPMQLIAAVSGITTAWAAYRLLPKRALAAQAWVGRRSLGIYAGQMVMLPMVLVGGTWGWTGVGVSEVTTMVSSGALAWVLERTALTRGVFLGQWPKPARAGVMRRTALGTTPTPLPGVAEEHPEGAGTGAA